MTRTAVAALGLVAALCATGCRKNVEWKVRIEDPKTGDVEEVGSTGPADRRAKPAPTEPKATTPAEPSRPTLAEKDIAEARVALLAWIRTVLGLDPSDVTIEMARADGATETVTFRWGLTGEPGDQSAVRVKRGRGGSWTVSEVHDAQIDAFVEPEAWLMGWRRSRASDTMKVLRTLATAVESYSIDNNEYPNPNGQLAAMLAPTYVKAVPKHDEWGRRFRYSRGATGQTYCIESSGANGRFDAVVNPDAAPPSPPGDDLVFCTGDFLEGGGT